MAVVEELSSVVGELGRLGLEMHKETVDTGDATLVGWQIAGHTHEGLDREHVGASKHNRRVALTCAVDGENGSSVLFARHMSCSLTYAGSVSKKSVFNSWPSGGVPPTSL